MAGLVRCDVVFAAFALLTQVAAPSPLEALIRSRLVLALAPPEEVLTCLDHLLDDVSSPELLTPEIERTLAEHAVGGFRVMMVAADELLAIAANRDLPRLDEKP
jgi:hypothetical protein